MCSDHFFSVARLRTTVFLYLFAAQDFAFWYLLNSTLPPRSIFKRYNVRHIPYKEEDGLQQRMQFRDGHFRAESRLRTARLYQNSSFRHQEGNCLYV